MFRHQSVVSLVLQRTLRALFAQLRRRAKALGADQALPAALTAIQRFGGSLNPNVPFHVTIPDGVFVRAQPPTLRVRVHAAIAA